MKILYIFPHPDDESFGPAHAIVKQLRDGNEVYLLTLTRGGATRQRQRWGYTVEQMGEIRYREMLCVEKILGLSGMKVLDLPDSGLKEMNPSDIENVVCDHIKIIKPEIIVTYAVHGISGFHDHLVTHSVVKSAYCRMKEKYGYLKRLAFFTITKQEAEKQKHFSLNYSDVDEIDCITETSDEDIAKAIDALKCYKTYEETIKKSKIQDHITHQVVFEIFQEKFNPKLKNLTDNLN